jgi:hypothetical protein
VQVANLVPYLIIATATAIFPQFLKFFFSLHSTLLLVFLLSEESVFGCKPAPRVEERETARERSEDAGKWCEETGKWREEATEQPQEQAKWVECHRKPVR